MNTVFNRLKEISNAVLFAAEATSLQNTLERIAHAARDIAKTKYAALGVPDGHGGLLYFETSGMASEEIAGIAHPPIGRGLIGALMKERMTIILEHMREDPRSSGFPAGHPHMDSFLGVPIVVGARLYGMLYLCDKVDGQFFDEEDKLLVETLAGYAALAIASADLNEQQQRLNLLEERERIGMELHDGIIQSLYGIGMQVELMKRSNKQVNDGDLSMIVQNLNDVIDDIRGFITNLRGRTQQKTVRECFKLMIDRLHPPKSLLFHLDAPDEYPPFSTNVFDSICLIVNEAISNSIRHSGAQQVDIKVEMTKAQLSITVADNGRGFNLENSMHENGLGLRNMQHRAQMYGGKIIINSLVGRGTRLNIHIPIGTF